MATIRRSTTTDTCAACDRGLYGIRRTWPPQALDRAYAAAAGDAHGAERAIAHGKRSLLPSGVRAVDGRFGVGDCVRLVGPDGTEVARRLVSYGAADLDRIKGAHTRAITSLLGYKGSDEVVHRDDLVLTGTRH